MAATGADVIVSAARLTTSLDASLVSFESRALAGSAGARAYMTAGESLLTRSGTAKVFGAHVSEAGRN